MPKLLDTNLEAWGCRPFADNEKTGYLAWSLDFFTDSQAEQDPFLDITLQLDITDAYACYTGQAVSGLTFFSYLIWHLAHAIQGQISFKLRKVNDTWCVLENAPIVVPVAVGGETRFCELLLQNTCRQTLPEFALQYRDQLNTARTGGVPRMSPLTFYAATLMGNLPQIQFTAMNLHWRKSDIQCQPYFYFGQRYSLGERLMMPMAVKLHHACTDPLVLNALLEDFRRRIK
ncbi:hypothetical protein MASR1M60_09580 [Rhodocyclaceae bacterium]